MDSIDRVQRQTDPILSERCAKLKEIFPEVFSEDRIDFNKLRLALGDLVDTQAERYLFSWAGKTDAIRSLQIPSSGTLNPCFEESVDFEKGKHIFIEGENLEVLKLILKSYFGRVKMIYIDPPYNTGNDFIYRDNYKEPLRTYLRLTRQIDEDGNWTISRVESNGRYHSNWLSMMYPRLFLARLLLRDDGVLFVSIDDHEMANLRLLLNEVFGEENFVTTIVWQKKYTRSNDAKWFSNTHDYILVYARNKDCMDLHLEPRTREQLASYSNPDHDPRGPWKATPLHAKSGTIRNFSYTFKNGVTWSPPPGTYPRYSKETLARLDANNEIWFGKDGKSTPARKTFLSDVKTGVTPVTIWLHQDAGHNHEANTELKTIVGEGVFDNPKPSKLIKKMLKLATSPFDHDIVLDFFAGSCTTAQAVLELNAEDGGNRQFIMVQFPEPIPKDSPAYKAGYSTIANVGKERIRRVIQGYGKDPQPMEGIGFKVFKLAPSNFKQWEEYTGDHVAELVDQLSFFQTALVDGYRETDVIYEIILREGYDLNANIERVESVVTNTVYRITDPVRGCFFYLCLDERVEWQTLEALDLKRDNLFICLDTALDDTTKTNLALQCRLKTI